MSKHMLVDILGGELRYTFGYLRFCLSSDWRGSRKKVLVNASPKTGTTWMIRLITSVPGYRTAGNFQGNWDRYCNMRPGDVVHGHDRYSLELANILQANRIRVILTVRDPRDQTVSRMFHIKRDTTNPWHQRMIALDDNDALMVCIEGRPGLSSALSCARLGLSWFGGRMNVLDVRYEDLITDPIGQFRRVLSYLDVDVDDAFVQAIVARNRFERLSIGRRIWRLPRKPGQEDQSSHFRKGIVGDWKSHFKDDHIRRFKDLLGDLLIELGYEQDFDW